eukprot:101318_1
MDDNSTRNRRNVWKCSICTFENYDSIKCRICGHFIQEQSKTWSCEDCTYDNGVYSIHCQRCGASMSPRNEHENPNLSDNDSISIVSSSSTHNGHTYRHLSLTEYSDDVHDISYHDSAHAHHPQIKAKHGNGHKVWRGFVCKLFMKRMLFISSYMFSFVVQRQLIDLFSFCIYCPLLLIAIVLSMMFIPYFPHKIYSFLCLQHWLLRTVFHLMFRILNVINAILPLLCIGYEPISYLQRTDRMFYGMCMFILMYVISACGVDFVVYDASKCIVAAFKVFLHFVERYNYKLNDDGTWTNPLEDVKCVDQVNSKPIGVVQTVWCVFHFIGVIGTYTFCIFVVQ